MNNAITNCLWVDGQAKEMAEYYCGIFPNSKITSENPIVVTFDLNGNKFMALNGGPKFKFNESISFMISCDTQAEIDHYWNQLTTGGQESMCGWLLDKFGVSWQVVPSMLGKLMSNPETAGKVTQKFMNMRKFIIADLMDV